MARTRTRRPLSTSPPALTAEGAVEHHQHPEDQPEQSYSERQIFEAASSRLARELAAMEKTDEPAALAKILDVLRTHAPQYYESTTEDA